MTLVHQRDETDAGTFRDVFEAQYHRPLRELVDPKHIVDLGSHAGYTLVDFADLYPTATITGAEMDFDNWVMAIKNTGRYGSRVRVDRRAIADHDGECAYVGVATNAYSVVEGVGTPCSTLDSFLAAWHVTAVDYLKIDVEGVEASILKGGGAWPQITRQVSVELHGEYGVMEAAADLNALGFAEVYGHPTHPSAVVAWR